MRGKVFTTAAIDNIDHKPSSTTAKSSFHATAISLIQHPSFMGEGVNWTIVVTGTNNSSSLMEKSLQQASAVWAVFTGPINLRGSLQLNDASCISCSPPWLQQNHDQNRWHRCCGVGCLGCPPYAARKWNMDCIRNWKRIPIPGSPWNSS